MALTHSSCHSGDKRRNRELITNADEAVLDYEKLEHVGDGLLSRRHSLPSLTDVAVEVLMGSRGDRDAST